MKKKTLQKCSFCEKEFRALGKHTRWCKVKKNKIENLKSAFNTAAQLTPQVEPDWHNMYMQVRGELDIVKEKLRKTERSNRAFREAIGALSVGMARVMEIDL